MAYQVLARKWRPKRFQDVIGQNHITQSLQNAILRDKIGQAYIFTGTRGIGKTSVARLFAKALRCESPDEGGNPCNQCVCCQDFDTDTSMNVIEIDGASNNGVDNIRDLISEVQYLPSIGSHKIYIIDEVHMVTTQAFNALLKTLEEPPEHVVFIFATTEPEKLLGTVLSRCQRFDFRHATVTDLTNHLVAIAESEGVTYESVDLLKQIAVQGKGSVRDTLSLLDQVLSFSENNNITEETLVVSLGLARTSAIREIIAALLNGDAETSSVRYRSLLGENVSPKNIMTAILDALYIVINRMDNKRLVPEDISSSELFWIYETLAKDISWALDSIDPDKICEILLQKIALRRTFFNRSNSPKFVEEKKNSELEVQSGPIVQAAISEESSVEEVILEEEETPAPQEDEFEPPQIEEDACAEFLASAEDFQQEVPREAIEEEPTVQNNISADGSVAPWESFLEFVIEKSPVTASYLEQGNIIKPVSLMGERLLITLGFDEAGKTFYEYFGDREVRDKVMAMIGEFYQKDLGEIDLAIDLVEADEFVSRAEIEAKKEEEDRERRTQELINSPLVQEVKELFNGQIDKVILSDAKK